MNIRVEQTDDLDRCRALRRIVFIDEQGVSEADELDGIDDQCLHLLAFEGETSVGTARIKIETNTAKIGRVCVLPSHRGTGLGVALINAALELAKRQNGVTKAKLGAQVHALDFYAALGFKPIGSVYDDAGIDHLDMVRDL